MKAIKQFPNIAVWFGALAIITSVLLVFPAPRWLQWIMAVFWLGTGILGVYQGLKK
jgi:hypothetical protein